MRNFLRVTAAWAALIAWLAASGVSADVLQVFAYASHVVAHAEIMEQSPCGLCKAADTVRQTSEHSPLAKQEAAKVKVKSDGTVWSVHLSAHELSPAVAFREVAVSVFCPELICEVPVPPPKVGA